MARHLASLDAVRGLAALSVAVPHYFLFAGTQSTALEFVSAAAVELFFVLSGAVLAPQLMHCVETQSLADVRTFYLRRWLRTLPPYLFVLVAMAAYSKQLWSADFFQYAFFVRNLYDVKESNDFFLVAWSLAVEEWFYLIFPFFLLMMTRRTTAVRAALVFLAAFLIFKLVALIALPDTYETARRIVALRMDSICFGFLLSITLLPRAREVPLVALAGAGLVSIAVAVLGWLRTETLLFAYGTAVFGACFILAFARMERVFKSQWVSAVASFSAKTSYMVYLSHTLMILVLGYFGAPRGAPGLALYLAAVYGFCWIFYLSVEAPILANRPSYRVHVAA